MTSLVIVESPAKARTIAGYLGGDFVVESSIGHIRDLPRSAADVPASHKGEAWARLGVDVDHDFAPLYVVSPDKKSQVDKELAVLLKLPGFLLLWLMALLKRLYAWGLAPRSLVDTDPLYTSAFVANLGSIKIDAAYHHLYEHGTCPLFVTIGQVTQMPAVVDGQLVAKPTVTLRYSFDERVEDGLYAARALKMFAERVEDPASWIP